LVEPTVLDLNLLIGQSMGMLRPLIGEDISIALKLESEWKLVRMDPTQTEQLLANMVVNAKDAMPRGGTLTIGTYDDAVDQVLTAKTPGKPTKRYVVLEVSDDGMGMSDEVKAHIFEPFFTTKVVDEGTGLGLATCYGIIKQAGGEIQVETALGKGTTFRIYLPSANEEVTPVDTHQEHEILPGGTERVLLVEDDEKVRTLASKILLGQGYSVLEAANGVEALAVAEDFTGDEIHLLLTDVIMPKMGGLELADRLMTSHPRTKVLYWSGYTNRAFMGDDGVLKENIAFMPKPFSPPALTLKVREVLNS